MTTGEAKQPETGGDSLPRFEVGPIRPPSEAHSLLVRVNRNCPWNRCRFCPVYKGRSFRPRRLADVLSDLEAMARTVALLHDRAGQRKAGFGPAAGLELDSTHAQVATWLAAGGRTVFLQDANAFCMKPEALAAIARRIRELFPHVERITAYARSHTLARISAEGLAEIRAAGLNRIHVGLESGSDKVLTWMEKGCTQAEHIEAGRKVIAAGFELSEYVMPGLGGKTDSAVHARETSAALKAIEPHFTRFRSLGIRGRTPLVELVRNGDFIPCGEEQMVTEIRQIIEGMADCATTVVSDHMLNLLPEVQGRLPSQKDRVLGVLDRFLSLSPKERKLFIVGRRAGFMWRLAHLDDRGARAAAAELIAAAGRRGADPEVLARQMVARFL
jgi:hypothetical protein